jgi:DNA-binding transcriptional ArsR family regulator
VDEDLEAVWKALADPSRRRILDLLRDGPRTTNAIAAAFPVTRFAIMKHLRILEASGLVLVERRGRERWNHLNAVPLRRIYERWISGYADLWAASLVSLKRHLERPRARPRRRSR